MVRLNSTLSTFVIASIIATGVSTIVAGDSLNLTKGVLGSSAAQAQSQAAESGAVIQSKWAASATGRVEPKSGPVKISSLIGGRIDHIVAATNDTVRDGDLLVLLDDTDAMNRVRSARSEEAVRLLERGEEEVTGVAKDRHGAEDKVAAVQRELFDAWREVDQKTLDLKEGRGNRTDIDNALSKTKSLETKLGSARDELARLNADPEMPMQNRLETSLSVARAELALAENALERTRIRAPFDGTVLNIYARAGEVTAPTPESALLVFGDLSKLRVRAELEERDVAKVRVGQKVVVRADAFPDREFEGTVTEIASTLGSPRITSRGPRRPDDVDVLEVVANLDGSPPLLTGMRVDVFFKRTDKGDQSAAHQQQ